jgi:hypothetical protein
MTAWWLLPLGLAALLAGASFVGAGVVRREQRAVDSVTDTTRSTAGAVARARRRIAR